MYEYPRVHVHTCFPLNCNKMYVCILLYLWSMGVGMTVYTHVYIWVKSFSNCFLCLFFETGSFNRPEAIQPYWLAMSFKDIPVPLSPIFEPYHWGYRHVPSHWDVFLWVLRIQLSSSCLHGIVPSLPVALILDNFVRLDAESDRSRLWAWAILTSDSGLEVS